MTLIAIWSDSPSEHVYIASDSRLSDIYDKTKKPWDCASKIFQVADFSEVVAYCGKTEPLLVAISQTAQCLRYTDNLSKSGNSMAPQLTTRVTAACKHLDDAIKSYPKGWMGSGGNMFFVGYDKRERKPRVFRVRVNLRGVICKKDDKPFEQKEVDFSTEPQFFGSGEKTAKNYLAKNNHDNANAAFNCLKSTIFGERIRSVGGVPQVFRVDAKGVTPIGIVLDGEAFLGGMKLQYRSKMKNVEWRDKSFNICEYLLDATVKRSKQTKRKKKPKNVV